MHTNKSFDPGRAEGGMVHSVELTGTYLSSNVIYFQAELWTWPVHRQVNLVWVEEELSD